MAQASTSTGSLHWISIDGIATSENRTAWYRQEGAYWLPISTNAGATKTEETTAEKSLGVTPGQLSACTLAHNRPEL
eukprot:4632277-Pyramimonas_sp.AAC.1